ncbi:hypothetical protein BDV98DRAFT_567398 [Pterulicium gracile]|uniref:Uncharacterized protein n=1 Tax=Pterulicium gracile TaxID=1884261 RepID=A0A5C3QI32_9AGAR|nr:hypothetical protein BDV98DRAFT_567398 [Pterula gracilis]
MVRVSKERLDIALYVPTTLLPSPLNFFCSVAFALGIAFADSISSLQISTCCIGYQGDSQSVGALVREEQLVGLRIWMFRWRQVFVGFFVVLRHLS